MKHLVLPTLLVALGLAGCGSDTICPIGFYAIGSACIPFEAADVSGDTAETDLGDAGVIDDGGTTDTPTEDTPMEDTPIEDTPMEDTPMEDTPMEDTVPDAPEPDVVPDVEEDVCVPDCTDFECGSDGCGGICGSCGGDESCIDGLCERDPVPPAADCAAGFECVADCGLTDECFGACGVFSASDSIQGEIFSALTCAEGECGDDTTSPVWQSCAETCTEVQSCFGIVTTDGACTGGADAAVLDAVGVDAITDIMGECSIGCFTSGDPAECISVCVEDGTRLSGGCSDCFGQTGACTLTSCIFDCISPGSPGCASCVETNCGPAFSECAGLGFPG